MNIFQRNAKIVVMLAFLAAATGPIFIRMASGMPALTIGFYRMLIAMPFFVFSVLIWHRKELFGLNRKQVTGSILTGFFLFLHFFTLNLSLVETTVASVMVLSSLHPIIILIITVLVFKEKISHKILAGVLIAMVGAIIITSGDYSFGRESLYGDFLAFLAGLLFALYLVAGRRLRIGINSMVYMFLVFGSTLVFFTISMVITGTSFVGYPKESYLAVLAIAIFNQTITHGVFNWSLGYVSSLFISINSTLNIVLVSFLAFLIFDETPMLWQYIGGVITICGIILYNYSESQSQKEITEQLKTKEPIR